MCKNCLISLIATFFLVYFLLIAITAPIWNVWVYSLVITLLVVISVAACPVLNKEGLSCCGIKPKKAVKKAVKKKK